MDRVAAKALRTEDRSRAMQPTSMVSPGAATKGRLSRALDRLGGKGRQQLLELDEEAMQGDHAPDNGFAKTLGGSRTSGYVMGADGVLVPADAVHQWQPGSPEVAMQSLGRPLAPSEQPPTPSRVSPAAAAAGKLSRAFERMRGRGERQQLVEWDGEDGIAPRAPDASMATHCTAQAPSAMGGPFMQSTVGAHGAVAALVMGSWDKQGPRAAAAGPSELSRSSPGAAAMGKVSRGLDRMLGRRAHQHLEEEGAEELDVEAAAVRSGGRAPSPPRPEARSGELDVEAATWSEPQARGAPWPDMTLRRSSIGNAGNPPCGGHFSSPGAAEVSLPAPEPWLLRARRNSPGSSHFTNPFKRSGEEASLMV